MHLLYRRTNRKEQIPLFEIRPKHFGERNRRRGRKRKKGIKRKRKRIRKGNKKKERIKIKGLV